MCSCLLRNHLMISTKKFVGAARSSGNSTDHKADTSQLNDLRISSFGDNQNFLFEEYQYDISLKKLRNMANHVCYPPKPITS